MRRIILLMLFVLTLSGSAWAQATLPGEGNELEDVIRSGIQANVLQMNCNLPQFRPLVSNLRGSYQPDVEGLIKMFFIDRKQLLGEEQIESPRWGTGRRYKSGTVLFVGIEGLNLSQDISGAAEELEIVPIFFDAYDSGFVYKNNLPHTAVLATDVKQLSAVSADITRYKVFEEGEGQATAEQLVSELFGELSVPAGFQSNVGMMIQEFGERLFVYHVMPEFITTYADLVKQTGADGEIEWVEVERPVAVPVLDSYALVLLDGDKLLVGVEYFWDRELAPIGELRECISADEALIKATRALMKQYNNEPPLMEVSQIKLGYIQDRNNHGLFIPAWIFDAWYPHRNDYSDPTAATAGAHSSAFIHMANTFAINALNGEMIDLTPGV